MNKALRNKAPTMHKDRGVVLVDFPFGHLILFHCPHWYPWPLYPRFSYSPVLACKVFVFSGYWRLCSFSSSHIYCPLDTDLNMDSDVDMDSFEQTLSTIDEDRVLDEFEDPPQPRAVQCAAPQLVWHANTVDEQTLRLIRSRQPVTSKPDGGRLTASAGGQLFLFNSMRICARAY